MWSQVATSARREATKQVLLRGGTTIVPSWQAPRHRLFSTTAIALQSTTAHPPHLSSGVKSTLPSSAQPINLHHAYDKLQQEQRDDINDGDRGYLAFTKASLFKLTLPLFPPDTKEDPLSPTSKASSAYSHSILNKIAKRSTRPQQGQKDEPHNAESESDTGPISAEPWERRVDNGAKISQVESEDNSAHVKRKGKSGSTNEAVSSLHGPEQGEPADDQGQEFDAKAPAKSVVFLLHSGQPLSYISSLIQAEQPSLHSNSTHNNNNNNTDAQRNLSHSYDPTITFHTRVSDGKRWSPATGIGDFLRDAARIGSFVVKIGKERTIRVSVPSFEDRTRFLRASLYAKTGQIEKMSKLKLECDSLAHHGTRRFAIGGAGLLATWWVMVTYGTFFTSLGWDVLEPMTVSRPGTCKIHAHDTDRQCHTPSFPPRSISLGSDH